MSTVRIATETMQRHPLLIGLLGILSLIFCFFENNIFLPVLSGLSKVGIGDIFGSIISFVRLIFNLIIGSNMIIAKIIFLIIFLIITSALSSIIFSGSANVIKNSFEGKPKVNGEFRFGIKKYFIRMFFVSFKAILFGIIFIIFLLVASIPALVVTKVSMTGKPELILIAIVALILTSIVLFFCFTFFRMYMVLWFPSAVAYANSAFSRGKYIADRNFWNLTTSFLKFDIAFIAFNILLAFLNSNITMISTSTEGIGFVFFIINWIFKTLFFTLFIVYTFSCFYTLKDEV